MNKKRPSAGLSKAKKKKIVKQIRSGKDMGKVGKLFDKVKAKAKKFYIKKGKSPKKAEETATKVAAASLWRNVKR